MKGMIKKSGPPQKNRNLVNEYLSHYSHFIHNKWAIMDCHLSQIAIQHA